ncbi:MAG: hypothetical protein HZB18_03985 [Chloroflexi bacterium]|nr:hypothetical protein [Chloroflexota bacterium]
MTNKKEMTSLQWVQLVAGAAIVLGSIVRFLPGLQAGFPLNDGGMFLQMIRDLKDSGYALPQVTSYNQLQIPYAYPPLGFYIGRALSDLFRISEVDLLRWAPPLVNSFSILVFYMLARELLKSKPLGALASAFYALTPGAFGWFVMGGGLTRSFGSMFFLLSIFFVLRLFQTGRGKFVGASVAFCGLTVLSHPEAGIHAAWTCILMWLVFGRTIQSVKGAVLVGAGTLAVTSPWWLTVISFHGLAPFLSAMHTGSYGTPLWTALTKMIVGDGVIPVLAMLRLIGLGWGLWKKQYFLLAWTFLPYLVEPRSAPSVAFYPLTMLIALAFAEAIPFLISRLRNIEMNFDELYKSKVYNAFFFLVLTLLFVDSGLYGFRLVGNSLKPADREAMTWITEHTPVDANFLLLTGIQSPEIDPFVEWFPALTERRSQSTIQGYEWLLADKFFERYTKLAELQRCESIFCVEDWSARMELPSTYFVIVKSSKSGILAESFYGSLNYIQVYSNNRVLVFEAIK